MDYGLTQTCRIRCRMRPKLQNMSNSMPDASNMQKKLKTSKNKQTKVRRTMHPKEQNMSNSMPDAPKVQNTSNSKLTQIKLATITILSLTMTCVAKHVTTCRNITYLSTLNMYKGLISNSSHVKFRSCLIRWEVWEYIGS
jgi:hypothetical protein